MRAFIGIALSDSLRSSLGAAANALRDAAPDWRGEKWVARENLHITVQFLGKVEATTVPTILEALRAATATLAPYRAELVGIVARPRAHAASMLWASAQDNGATGGLAVTIARALQPLGYPPPDRRLVPHITLVRARRPRPVDLQALQHAKKALVMPGIAHPTMSVREITLYASTLTESGPVYHVLGRSYLGRD